MDGMLAGMTSRELTEWMAFTALDGPFGEERADMRAALIACAIANPFRGPRRRPFELKDFLLKFGGGPGGQRRPKTLAQTKEFLAALTLSMGGHVDQKILDEIRPDHVVTK